MKKNSNNKGFTLIEILVVIAIIAILASIVLVAINPKKHFDDAKAAQREANANTVLNSISQYIVANKGNLPSFMDETNGSSTNDDFVGNAKEVDEELCDVLVPEFVGAIPSDPDSNSKGATFTDCTDVDANDIKYTVEVMTEGSGANEKLTGHVQVCTTIPTDDICVSR